MLVRLKGINRVRKKLADGREVVYYYAWKGGPKLEGKPGSPEFKASYDAAIAKKVKPNEDVLLSVLQAYQESGEFTGLATRTRADYIKQIKLIEKKFADFPLAALTDRRTRGVFKTWRDERAKSSRRQADYAWTVLARVLSWAYDRGDVLANPCERGGRLYRAKRTDKVWTADDEKRFFEVAPKHLHLPLLLGLWTGQRQGDLLRLTWSAYDGKTIRLRQSKTGSRVVIPVGAPLKAALDAQKRAGLIILNTADGKPWTPDGFRSSWGKACDKAGITDLTFHDLRGTAVSRLALVGCTEAEIAAMTGHSLKDVAAILDAHYLHRDPALAQNAVTKLEMGGKTPN